VLVEASSEILGAPFIIMERLEGITDTHSIHLRRFDATRQEIARRAFAVLGDLAAIDVGKLDVVDADRPRTAAGAWSRELDFWESMHDRFRLQPLPMTRAAIRALRANPPPPPPRLTVVHGDYRFGNFLYNEAGEVNGVLDWEMTHLGDPHEDLAWAMMQNWRWRNGSLVWGFVEDVDAALQCWEQASGLIVDQRALAWWRLFSEVKAAALWVRAANAPMTGKPYYLLLNWRSLQQEQARMAADIEAVWS
jgi:aminoglycoside phosphotransferase (APT) family kinase protein